MDFELVGSCQSLYHNILRGICRGVFKRTAPGYCCMLLPTLRSFLPVLPLRELYILNLFSLGLSACSQNYVVLPVDW